MTVAEFTEKIDGPHQILSIPCAGAFAIAIWNSGYAAYIRLANTVSDDELYLQLKYDTDASIRFLTALCTAYRMPARGGTSPADLARTFKTRAVKNLLLEIQVTLDTPEIQILMKTFYQDATNSPDRLAVFTIELDRAASDSCGMG